MATIFEAAADPQAKTLLEDLSIGHNEVVRRLLDIGVFTTESSVRRYRSKYKKTETIEALSPEKVETPLDPGSGQVEVDPDGATITRVVVTTPIVDDGDWAPILEMFGLNPEHFEVVDDTVRMKSWWVARGKKEEDRWEPLQMFSYDARFRRINKDMVPQAKVTEWTEALLADRPPVVLLDRLEPVNVIPTTYPILIADPQLGKKGTEEAVHNWQSGLMNHINAIQRLQYQGQFIERVHLAFMGDEHENVVNSYTNQPHTVELNRSQQLELDYDLSVWSIKKVADLGLPISVSSVISNHGLWTRNASKDPVTTNNDNSSTFIRRQVRKLFEELEPFGGPKIGWTIGETAPGVVVDLSGVPSYFSHGFIEKGRGGSTEVKVENAVKEQILGDTDRLGAVPLWFMAHYHHFYTNEFQDRTLFGCPALEALKSSEYMKDQYGVWSNPGMLGLLVGNHTTRKFSDVNVF